MWRGLFELLIPSVCPACDQPRAEEARLLCRGCAGLLERWPRLGDAHTVIAYRGTGRVLVRRFKFQGRRDALAVLRSPLCDRLAELDFEAVVTVPRPPDRVRSQGCDPAHALARMAARSTRRPLVAGLRRCRSTQPQTDLPPDARRTNVAGSFQATRAVRGRRVLLLDDITTTGATLEAATACLLDQGGARHVERAALAGTPPEALPFACVPGL